MYGILWKLNKKLTVEEQIPDAAARFFERTGLKATTIQIPGYTGNGKVEELADLHVVGGPGYESIIIVGVEEPYAVPEDD